MTTSTGRKTVNAARGEDCHLESSEERRERERREGLNPDKVGRWGWGCEVGQGTSDGGLHGL